MKIAKLLIFVSLLVGSCIISFAEQQNGAVLAATPVAAKAANAAAQPDVEKRVDSILSRMTLGEKIDYIGGYTRFYVRPIPRLGIPQLKMSDGPVGVRTHGKATAMPAGIAMAASWDTELVNRVGKALGQDARARGVHFLLAPGMNIYRAPMAGRNFEYFGEDPFLASRMAVAVIQGVQSEGVSATAKHFAANNEEWDRHTISSDVDERTLREIYLPAFEASVKEGHVGAVMDSYNLVNGTHMTQNEYLNNEVVKKEWGFTGVIMSDWDATYDGIAAVNSGLDLEMPLPKMMTPGLLLAAVRDGRVSEATIDDHVRRILRTAVEFGWLDSDQTDVSIPLDNPKARQASLDAALGSMVLLKNEHHIMPLDKSKLKTIAVLGPLAANASTGGGGSSHTDPFESTSFLKGIQDYVGNEIEVLYADGSGDSLQQAKERAEKADAVILCVGFTPATEYEGNDRTYQLPNAQDELIRAIEAVNKNTILVLTAGGSVKTDRWVDHLAGFIHAWYPGQQGGVALAKLLFGEVSPSGKLPISFERRWEDAAAFKSYYDPTLSPQREKGDATRNDGAARGHVAYKEGVFLGYRHFDKRGIVPLFPFGYGLSYTSFKYSNLKITPDEFRGNEPVVVSFDVTNTGKRAGAEVAEVYVGDTHAKVPRPVKELKGFSKLMLEPGETRRVTVPLIHRAFSYYDVNARTWTADPGPFTILVGGSSQDLPLEGSVWLK